MRFYVQVRSTMTRTAEVKEFYSKVCVSATGLTAATPVTCLSSPSLSISLITSSYKLRPAHIRVLQRRTNQRRVMTSLIAHSSLYCEFSGDKGRVDFLLVCLNFTVFQHCTVISPTELESYSNVDRWSECVSVEIRCVCWTLLILHSTVSERASKELKSIRHHGRSRFCRYVNCETG
jgi:hypothetical protein